MPVDRAFTGFTPLTANFLYCPNQLFDACLPYCSRGAVRLVAYFIRRTLGWLDEFGKPIEQRIMVSYSELADEARISSGGIRTAIDEAIEKRFIRCIAEGHANTKGVAARSARYELSWDRRNHYTREPGEFAGFFAGDGHRSPIPNGFFDVVIPSEPLAVVQVVGAVLRHTVGYQVQFGGRRQQAPLSHSFIQQYTHIRGRHHVQAAIRRALDANYIRLVKAGTFSPTAASRGEAAHYAVKWIETGSVGGEIASKRLPEETVPAPSLTPQKSNQPPRRNRLKKVTSDTPKRLPDQHLEKVTEEKTLLKDTSKQQHLIAVADESVMILQEAGFDQRTARDLSRLATADEIMRQIRWIDRRTVSRNRLGMLRSAIVEGWEEPQSPAAIKSDDSPAVEFARGFYAELGNNRGRSVASPSANDLAAVGRLMDRTAGFITSLNAEQSGRQFASLTKESRGSTTSASSLGASLRSFGDRFAARLDAQIEAARRVESQKEAESREARRQTRYDVYVEQALRKIASERPAEIAAFEFSRTEKRVELARSRIGSKHLVAYHDSDKSRIEDFLAYFNRDVLTYRQWRELHLGDDAVTAWADDSTSDPSNRSLLQPVKFPMSPADDSE